MFCSKILSWHFLLIVHLAFPLFLLSLSLTHKKKTQVLAVKKFDPLSFSGSSDFMDLVNSISKLRHPNISELVGYCSEPGHYMLVYDYNMNGSLYDFLHLSDDYSKPLTWDTRVRIAVGTACALE